MIRIYSVGVWNRARKCGQWDNSKLEFTPLEFETCSASLGGFYDYIRIYSVGVWNIDVAKATNKTHAIRIYSVGVWNLMQVMRQFVDPY